MKFTYQYFVVFFSFFIVAYCQGSLSEDKAYAEYEILPLQSKISQTKDTRKDGISYQRDKILALHNLKESQGQCKAYFSKPGRIPPPNSKGPQTLSLELGSKHWINNTDSLLRQLLDSFISPESSWDIDIVGFGGCTGNITLLSDVIRILPQINTLKWRTSSPIPQIILRTLEASHPDCHLYYELYDWESHNHQNWFPDAIPISDNTTYDERYKINSKNSGLTRSHIMNSANLYSLKSEIIYGYRSDSSSMDHIFDILTSCPNTRELELSVEHWGCEPSSYATYGFNFQQMNTTHRLPPLEVLKLNGYDFETQPNGEGFPWNLDLEETKVYFWPWSKLPTSFLNWIGYPWVEWLGGARTDWVNPSTGVVQTPRETNLDIWLQKMDWSHLHTLSLSNPTSKILQKLGGKVLPSLKHVSFETGWSSHFSVTYILGFLSNTSSPLESITIENIRDPIMDHILDIIERYHGSTLYALKLTHEPSKRPQIGLGSFYVPKDWSHPNTSFLNSTTLSHLRTSIPNLQSLGIDIETKEEWDYEIIDTLASFEGLRELTLRFEPETEGQVFADYATPEKRAYNELVESVLRGLGAYLREKKRGVRFEKVEAWVGWQEFRI